MFVVEKNYRLVSILVKNLEEKFFCSIFVNVSGKLLEKFHVQNMINSTAVRINRSLMLIGR
jgi:hypothetical protein